MLARMSHQIRLLLGAARVMEPARLPYERRAIHGLAVLGEPALAIEISPRVATNSESQAWRAG
jgi:hypothetical protein